MTPNTIKHLGAKKNAFDTNPLNGVHSQTYHIKQDPNDDHLFVNQCILRLCRDKSSIDARKTRAQTNTKWSNCIVLSCTPLCHRTLIIIDWIHINIVIIKHGMHVHIE
eukprot:501652_1